PPPTSAVSPSSFNTILEPGAHRELPNSTSHSIQTVPPLPSETASSFQLPVLSPSPSSQVDTGSPTAGVSVALALRALSQLCQHESDPLCASLTELLQKLSSILLVLSGKQQQQQRHQQPQVGPRQPDPVATPENLPVEPFDRISITHLSLGDHHPAEHSPHLTGNGSTGIHLLPTKFPWPPAASPLTSSLTDHGSGASNLWSLSKPSTLSSTSNRVSFVVSPRSINADNSLVTAAHQVEDKRTHTTTKQTLSKRHRTSSASAFVSPYSRVTSSPSQVTFGQPKNNVAKSHLGLLSDTRNRPTSISHPDTHAKFGGGGGATSMLHKRGVSVETHADRAHPNSPVAASSNAVNTTSTTSSGRSDVKKCRKMYGIENRDQWCNQCRWKKACRRFPDPASTKSTSGSSNMCSSSGRNRVGTGAEASISPTGSMGSKSTHSNSSSSTELSTTTMARRQDRNQALLGRSSSTTTTANATALPSKLGIPVTAPTTMTTRAVTVPTSATNAAFLVFPKVSTESTATYSSDEFCSRSAPAVFHSTTNTTLGLMVDTSSVTTERSPDDVVVVEEATAAEEESAANEQEEELEENYSQFDLVERSGF
ncbi:unnamed protein product, partial [Echinostoma caproni]|uniref:Zinc finger, CCHC domain containing n=1 Tax=Echinostoma caproni TaxID=27848 RepID=A0A183AXS6_9TREM